MDEQQSEVNEFLDLFSFHQHCPSSLLVEAILFHQLKDRRFEPPIDLSVRLGSVKCDTPNDAPLEEINIMTPPGDDLLDTVIYRPSDDVTSTGFRALRNYYSNAVPLPSYHRSIIVSIMNGFNPYWLPQMFHWVTPLMPPPRFVIDPIKREKTLEELRRDQCFVEDFIVNTFREEIFIEKQKKDLEQKKKENKEVEKDEQEEENQDEKNITQGIFERLGIWDPGPKPASRGNNES
eukprot:GHVN01090096.1.p3 GENE.GHVN01090096.1~~GHVN01090096.1.p3  ORF type:complete len:235 (+),score=32.92 GHVN01090096.1:3984-4688(+)